MSEQGRSTPATEIPEHLFRASAEYAEIEAQRRARQKAAREQAAVKGALGLLTAPLWIVPVGMLVVIGLVLLAMIFPLAAAFILDWL